MSRCHEMRRGDVLVCTDCAFELVVSKECHGGGHPAKECCKDSSSCAFTCCAKEMVWKAREPGELTNGDLDAVSGGVMRKKRTTRKKKTVRRKF